MHIVRPLAVALVLVFTCGLSCDSRKPTAGNSSSADTSAATTSAAAKTTASEPAFHTYRQDATDPTDKRLAVLLHGYGADERDLVGAARRAGLQGPLVGIRAPERAGNGWAWFPIDFRASRRYSPDAADAVLVELARFLEQLADAHPSHEVVVLGFSQGAMLAMMLAVEHPDSLDRAIALSGTLPRPVETPPGWDPAKAPLIYAIHGTADTVIPLERARQAQKWLESAGAEPTYMEYDGMKHTIGPAVIHDLQNYLRR